MYQESQPDYPPSVCFLPKRLFTLRQRLDHLLAKANEQAILKEAETERDRQEVGMQIPAPTLWEQLTPEQRARIIATLIQTLPHPVSQPTEADHDPR